MYSIDFVHLENPNRQIKCLSTGKWIESAMK